MQPTNPPRPSGRCSSGSIGVSRSAAGEKHREADSGSREVDECGQGVPDDQIATADRQTSREAPPPKRLAERSSGNDGGAEGDDRPGGGQDEGGAHIVPEMDARASAPEENLSPVRSSELLGFPPDARVLIINCDDFGMYHAVNVAVVRSIEEGIARSCSLMVPCPWALHAMELLGDHPEIPFGIHLTLLIDVPHYRWGPLTARERVPSLLDEAGEMFAWDRTSDLLARARLDEVELEFRAQIIRVVDAGLAPTHLDFHSLADGGRDDILDLTVALALEYGMAVRVWLEPGRQRLRARGLPVDDYPLMDSTRISLDGKAARFAELVHELPVGLSEWAVHPSLGNEESQAVDSLWRQRQTDYEFLMSSEARELIREEGIEVIDYRPMQRAWSGSGLVG
jgi:predicted glycoside hydrolase/deacetylase ChbG (UPF0249 family)